MCTVLLPPGVKPVTVNKIYHISNRNEVGILQTDILNGYLVAGFGCVTNWFNQKSETFLIHCEDRPLVVCIVVVFIQHRYG